MNRITTVCLLTALGVVAIDSRLRGATPIGPADERLSNFSRFGQERNLFPDEYLFKNMDLTRPGLEKMKAGVDDGDLEQAWKEWAFYFGQRDKPVWLLKPEPWRQMMETHYPAFRQAWIDAADEILQGRVRGEFEVPLKNGEPDWFAAPKKKLTDYGMGMRYLYFVFTRPLIRAYVLTEDETYAENFIQYYLAYDRYKRPSHKLRELWIGIRVCILFEGYYLLRNSRHMTPEAHRVMLRDLYWMTRWLSDFYRLKGNGYLNPAPNQTVPAASWLIQAGLMMPEFREAEQWLRQGKPKLEAVLERSVYPDGGQVEICTQYHKTVMRDVLAASLVMERNTGQSYLTTEPMADRFQDMFRWLGGIVTPTGYTPALNSAVYARDWLVFLATGNRYIRDPEIEWRIRQVSMRDYIPVQKKEMGLAAFLFNEDAAPGTGRIKGRQPDSLSKNLPDSGFAVLRDKPGSDALYVILDYGHPVGGHAYPSRLSFVLWGNGVPLALQPGSPFWYHDPMYRKWYHTTLSHNTVVVNAHSHQARKNGRNVFGILLTWFDSTQTAAVAASHDGYLSIANVTHTRKVILAKGSYFFVSDALAPGRKGNQYEWSFHSPLTLQPQPDRSVRTAESPGIQIIPAYAKEIEQVKRDKGPSMLPVLYSDHLDDQQGEINYVNLIKQGEGVQTFGILLLPFKEKPHPWAVRPLESTTERATAEAFEIRMGPRRREVLVFRHGNRALCRWPDLVTDAAMARIIESGGETSLAVVDARRLEWQGRVLLDEKPPVSREFPR